MYQLITLVFFAFYSTFASSQELKGIQFRTDYTAAFTVAEQEDKLIFLYFYVPDCTTCDWVEKDFGNKSLGKLYNDHYLSYALDAAGTGKQMAEYFGVFSFPTMLYVNPDGDVKFGTRGYRDGKSIFETGKLSIQSNKDIRKTMDRKYKANPNDTDHLYDYIEYQFVRKDFKKGNKLLKEYLKQRENIEKASWMNLVLDYANDTESYAHEVLQLEKELFTKEFGEKLINEIIWSSMITKLSQKTNPNDFARFEKKFIKEIIDEGDDPKGDELILFYSKYLFTNPVVNQVRLSSSDITLLNRYALESISVKNYTFERAHLIATGVYIIRYYQVENALSKLNEALAVNFEKDRHYSYLDLQSVALYLLGEEEKAVEKIVAAQELAVKSGAKNFKPSITEFKRKGIVK